MKNYQYYSRLQMTVAHQWPSNDSGLSVALTCKSLINLRSTPENDTLCRGINLIPLANSVCQQV